MPFHFSLLATREEEGIVSREINGTTYYNYSLPARECSQRDEQQSMLPTGVGSFESNGTTFFHYSQPAAGQGGYQSSLPLATNKDQDQSEDTTQLQLPANVTAHKKRNGLVVFTYNDALSGNEATLQQELERIVPTPYTFYGPDPNDIEIIDTVLDDDHSSQSADVEDDDNVFGECSDHLSVQDQSFTASREVQKQKWKLVYMDEHDVHHFNWLGDPIRCKTYTPPSVSLFAIMTPPKAAVFNQALSLSTNVVLKNAMSLVDPILYWGPSDILHTTKGCKLREAVTGACAPFYSPVGGWHQEQEELKRCGQIEQFIYTDELIVSKYTPEDVILNGWYENHGVSIRDDIWPASKRTSDNYRQAFLRRMRNGVGMSQLNPAWTAPIPKEDAILMSPLKFRKASAEAQTVCTPERRSQPEAFDLSGCTPIHVRINDELLSFETSSGSGSEEEVGRDAVFSQGSGSQDSNTSSSNTSPTVESFDETRSSTQTVDETAGLATSVSMRIKEEVLDELDTDYAAPLVEDFSLASNYSARSCSLISLLLTEATLALRPRSTPQDTETSAQELSTGISKPFASIVPEEHVEEAAHNLSGANTMSNHVSSPVLQISTPVKKLDCLDNSVLATTQDPENPSFPARRYITPTTSPRISKLPVSTGSPIRFALTRSVPSYSLSLNEQAASSTTSSDPFRSLRNIEPTKTSQLPVSTRNGGHATSLYDIAPDGEVPMPDFNLVSEEFSSQLSTPPHHLSDIEEDEEDDEQDIEQASMHDVASDSGSVLYIETLNGVDFDDILSGIEEHFTEIQPDAKCAFEVDRLFPRSTLTPSEGLSNLNELTEADEASPTTLRYIEPLSSFEWPAAVTPKKMADRMVTINAQPIHYDFIPKTAYSGHSAAQIPFMGLGSPTLVDPPSSNGSDEILTPSYTEELVEEVTEEQASLSANIENLEDLLFNSEPRIAEAETRERTSSVSLKPRSPLPTFRRIRPSPTQSAWSRITCKFQKKARRASVSVDAVTVTAVKPRKVSFGSLKKFFGKKQNVLN